MGNKTGRFAYGADLGWVSQLEALGYSWVDERGRRVDPLKAARALGVNAVRLRVFVDPPADSYWQKRPDERCMLGFCDIPRVTQMARRAAGEGLSVFMSIHYSDHFSDPEFQDIPSAWEHDTAERLEERVYAYTADVMNSLKNAGICPEWVQVGNEINSGILLPHGAFPDKNENLVRYMNAGYRAVKDISPESKTVTHLTEFYSLSRLVAFLDSFFALGGQTEILGFSNYPYWWHLLASEEEKAEGNPADEAFVRQRLTFLHERYGKPVMIAETGHDDDRPDECRSLLENEIRALKSLGRDGIGIFYWEPAVNRAVLPDAYPLGASEMAGDHTLRFTRALSAYLEADCT